MSENKSEIKFKGLSDTELAQKVMNGEFGNGTDRQNALGDRYNAVQKIINGVYNGTVDIVDLSADTNTTDQPEPQAVEINTNVPEENIEIEQETEDDVTLDAPVEIENEVETQDIEGTENVENNESNDNQETIDIKTDDIEMDVEETGNDGVLSEENLSNIEEATADIQDFMDGSLEDRASKYINNTTTGFNVTTNNLKYSISDDARRFMIACVAAESNKTKDDALGVASVILNRCDSGRWGGTDPVSVLRAPSQFSVVSNGSYLQYYNNPSIVPADVSQAVDDALNGVRNNNYQSFRSSGSTSYSNNQVVPGGNRYL